MNVSVWVWWIRRSASLLLLLRTPCLPPTCLQHDIMLCNSCELSNTHHLSTIIIITTTTLSHSACLGRLSASDTWRRPLEQINVEPRGITMKLQESPLIWVVEHSEWSGTTVALWNGGVLHFFLWWLKVERSILWCFTHKSVSVCCCVVWAVWSHTTCRLMMSAVSRASAAAEQPWMLGVSPFVVEVVFGSFVLLCCWYHTHD